jgi:hypothetical protein
MLEQAMMQTDKAYSGDEAKFPAHVIIESLNKLSVEDANRLSVSHRKGSKSFFFFSIFFSYLSKIFEHNGVKILLNILKSLHRMKKEQQASANALWMLSYNDKIKNFIRNNRESYEAICKLAESSVIDEIRISCKGMLMVLNDGELTSSSIPGIYQISLLAPWYLSVCSMGFFWSKKCLRMIIC